MSGGEALTTNNRMELMAAIKALKALKAPVPGQAHTDSNYVRDGITKWIHGWRRNGWRTADRSRSRMPICGRRCSTRAEPHRVEWHWVKGHSGHPRTTGRRTRLRRGRGAARLASERGAKSAGRCRQLAGVGSPRNERGAQKEAPRARSGCPSRPARAPEEARRHRVEAELHWPVGREGPQAGPFALDRLDRPVDRLLEPVDGDGDVDFLGRGVARVDQRLVERADPDAIVALALEIEALVKIGDERQVAQAGASDPKLDHRPPLGARAPAGDSRALATSSPQAPAALTRYRPGSGRRWCRRPSAGPRAAGARAASVRTVAAVAADRGQAGGWKAATSMSAQLASEPGAGPLRAQPGDHRGRARRGRDADRRTRR